MASPADPSVCLKSLALLLTSLLFSHFNPIQAATLAGQVTDDATGLGIEGAIVTHDLDPDASAETGLFGFYRFDDIPEDSSITITASHPAYIDGERAEDALAEDESRTLDFSLTRDNPSATILDVQVSVRAVNHGTPLEGVPVHAWRYSTAEGSDTPLLRKVRTDSNGNAHFRGIEAGYLQFSVNEPADTPLPFYESYPNPAGRTPLTDVSTDQILTTLLKHVPQTLTVQVKGFSPAAQGNTSLENAIVELTGLSPRNQKMVIPTRASHTDEAGRVTFYDLPPIPYELKVKLLGYDAYAEVISPDSGGNLPDGDYPVNIQYQPRTLALSLIADGYNDIDWLFQNISVKLDGITGTNTEDITRTINQAGDFTGSLRQDERIFENLLPGRYRVSLSGQSDLESYYPLPYFQGSGIVEMTDDIMWNGALTTSDGLNCVATPARITGRIYAADDSFSKNGTIYPRYLGKEIGGVVFGEITGNVAAQYFAPENRNLSVDANEDGFYSIQVLPAVYGISIPTATDYWGDHADVLNKTTGAGQNQGWPYPMTWPWPFPSMPPRGLASWPSLPLVLESGQDYVVDLYLHKKRGIVSYFYTPDDAAPSREILLSPEGNGPSVLPISLYNDLFTPDAEGVVASVSAIPDGGGDALPGRIEEDRVVVEHLPSGDYTLRVTHPRFTFPDQEFTVDEWSAPGIVPSSAPPPLGSNEGMPLHPTFPTPTFVETTYIPSTTTVSIIHNVFNESTEEYTTSNLGFGHTDYVQLPDLGDTIFDSEGRQIPTGSFTFWYFFNGGFWQQTVDTEGEEVVVELFEGGLSNTPPNSTGPSVEFVAIPKAVFSGDNSVLIPGATYTINDTTFAADGTERSVVGYILNVGTVSAATEWIKLDEKITFGGREGAKTRVNIDAVFTKLMTVSIVLKDIEDDKPITRASISLRPASGGALSNTQHQNVALKHVANGAYVVADPAVAAVLRAEDCLISIDAPGYKPYAVRLTPDIVPTVATLNHQASLERLPKPTVTKADLNRKGLFIPTIKLTGDESVFEEAPSAEDNPLIASWKIKGNAADPFTVTLPTVDGDPLANNSGDIVQQISDPVNALYLIDSRKFAGKLNDPNASIVSNQPEDPNNPASILEWIRSIENGSLETIIHQRTRIPAAANEFESGGRLGLADLPTGDFEPRMLAVTARGAAVYQEFPDYDGNREIHKLEGAAIPQWLSFATNVMTGMAAVEADIEKAASFVPFGDYTPLGNFKAQVEFDEVNDGFIDYNYMMGTEWSFGMPTPEEGFLIFAPGTLGINATAETSFGSRGFKKELYLQTVGTAENEPAELTKKRIPSLLRSIPDVEFEGTVTVTASTTTTRSYDNDAPYELEVKTSLPRVGDQVTGFNLKMTRTLDDVTSKIPVAGPKLLLLSKLGVLNFSGTLEGFLGLTADITFRTPRPTALPEGSTSQPQSDFRANRRSMFGGKIVSAVFTPQMSFGATVTTSVGSGSLEADLGVKIAGNKARGAKYVEFEVNSFSDWPWLKRVSGGIDLDLDARYNVYVWEGEKSFSWQALALDKQLGTQSVFQLSPMTIVQNIVTLADSSNVSMDEDSTQLVIGGSPLAPFTVVNSSTPIIINTEFNSTSGMLDIKGASRSGTAWGSSQTIASVNAITSIVGLTLPDGKALVAWGEIPPEEINKPFPQTNIYYSLENGSGEWATPAMAASLSGPAARLFPIEADTWSGLVILEESNVPGNQLQIHGLQWTGSTFGSKQTMSSLQSCFAFAATARGENGILLCVDENGLTQHSWDGSSFSLGTPDPGITTGPVAATSSDAGVLFTATLQGGAIVVDGFGGSTALIQSGASEMAMDYLADDTTPALVLAWAESGKLFSAFLNPSDGSLLQPIEELTHSDSGRYSKLALITGSDGRATLLSRYRQGSNLELREIEIALSPTHTLNDTDGDGIDDLAELRIIDADPDDDINTLDTVIGTEDFDQDGTDNATEINEGTDPIFGLERFIDTTEDLGIVSMVFAENGDLSITITARFDETYNLYSSNNLVDFSISQTKKADSNLLTFVVTGPIDDSFYKIERQ